MAPRRGNATAKQTAQRTASGSADSTYRNRSAGASLDSIASPAVSQHGPDSPVIITSNSTELERLIIRSMFTTSYFTTATALWSALTPEDQLALQKEAYAPMLAYLESPDQVDHPLQEYKTWLMSPRITGSGEAAVNPRTAYFRWLTVVVDDLPASQHAFPETLGTSPMLHSSSAGGFDPSRASSSSQTRTSPIGMNSLVEMHSVPTAHPVHVPEAVKRLCL